MFSAFPEIELPNICKFELKPDFYILPELLFAEVRSPNVSEYNTNTSDKHCITRNFNTEIDVSCTASKATTSQCWNWHLWKALALSWTVSLILKWKSVLPAPSRHLRDNSRPSVKVTIHHAAIDDHVPTGHNLKWDHNHPAKIKI